MKQEYARPRLGNKNAVKEAKNDTWIQIRVSSDVKKILVGQAEKEGLSLSKWALKTLENACTK